MRLANAISHIYFLDMIRQGTASDAPQVAPLFILAMGHIAGIFADSERYEDAIPFFESFYKRSDNQYSYVFTQVFEEEHMIIGSVTGYNGADLQILREPILDQIRKTKPGFLPDNETEAGEYYLDCINVHPEHQGKGIGQKLIQAFCDRAQSLGYNRVGLIVDIDNPRARMFYEKQGFIVAGQKSFMDHWYFHMVKAL